MLREYDRRILCARFDLTFHRILGRRIYDGGQDRLFTQRVQFCLQ